jgi:hypothetical protein
MFEKHSENRAINASTKKLHPAHKPPPPLDYSEKPIAFH